MEKEEERCILANRCFLFKIINGERGFQIGKYFSNFFLVLVPLPLSVEDQSCYI